MENAKLIAEKYAEAVAGIKEDWLSSKNTAWYDYIIGLPAQLSDTYMILVFHNQVFNGGFHQYFANGYGQFAGETIEALRKIGAIKRAELLDIAEKKVNSDNYPRPLFRKRLIEMDLPPLFQSDDLADQLESINDKYNSLEEEDIEELLGRYLHHF